MRARAKTIIHLLQQTQDFNSYILHLILFSLERLALTPRVSCDLVPFRPFPVFLYAILLMRQFSSLTENMARTKLNYEKQLPARRYNKTLLVLRHP